MAKPETNTNATTTPAAPKPGKAKPETVVIGISAAVPMPSFKVRQGKEVFPFESLEIGQSIGIIGRDAASLSSTVSSANKRARERPIDASTVDAVTGLPVPVKTMKAFAAFDCNPATDPDKATVRIFRLPNKAWEPAKVKPTA